MWCKSYGITSVHARARMYLNGVSPTTVGEGFLSQKRPALCKVAYLNTFDFDPQLIRPRPSTTTTVQSPRRNEELEA
jgi:hypothetical protein